MYYSCMATKTISLELDAYERLRTAKKPGESFSAVVRRAVFPEDPPTGAYLLDVYSRSAPRVSEEYLESVQAAPVHDLRRVGVRGVGSCGRGLEGAL